MSLNIATAIDSLVELVKVKKKITFEDAAKNLGLPENIISEWANFLEEDGIIKVTYKFTTPYLEIVENLKNENEEEDLSRRLDLATRKLQLILSKLAKFKVPHKYEISNIIDVKLLLKTNPKEGSRDLLFAQKFILEYKVNEVMETIKKIKILTPDLIKFIERKVKDLEEKREVFENNYKNI
jgi:DNA-binding Lrp family transcriptional regulator